MGDGNNKGETSESVNIDSNNSNPGAENKNKPEHAKKTQQKFEPLDLTKWPSMPAPWSSTDSGETWVWDDFFMTFHKKPMTILNQTPEMQGKLTAQAGLVYHYSMLVYYCLSKNTHGSSPSPIMAISLETDYADVLEHLGIEVLDEIANEEGIGAWIIGLFVGETRTNLGEYENDSHPEAVKKYFFEVLKDQLGLSGEPHKIGLLIDAYGHPDTGLEPNEQDKAKGPESRPKPEPKSEPKLGPEPESKPTLKPRSKDSQPKKSSSSQRISQSPKKGGSVLKFYGILVLVVGVVIWINNYEKAPKYTDVVQ